MIYHQSKYGHVIKIPTEIYFSLSDEDLEKMEQRYINADIQSVSYGGSSEIELDNIIDPLPRKMDFDDYGED